MLLIVVVRQHRKMYGVMPSSIYRLRGWGGSEIGIHGEKERFLSVAQISVITLEQKQLIQTGVNQLK